MITVSDKIFMSWKLEIVKQFQQQFPTSHIGGSMGLYLRGIDVGRNITESDLDMVLQKYEDGSIQDEHWQSVSNFDDFVASFRIWFANKGGAYYTKLEISEQPEQLYDIVEFQGDVYNVSKLSSILEFKKKYADKGCSKHQRDLHFIALQRETPSEYWYSQAFTLQYDDNSLPF